MAALEASWLSKTETPKLVQTKFGRFGDRLPRDGEISCGTTAMAMSVMWLIENGFHQLIPSARCTKDELGTELVFVFEGLEKNPSVKRRGPIYKERWYKYVIETYLSLKGIGPAHRKIDRRIAPDIPWLNEHNQDQAIVNFAIGWYNMDPNHRGTLIRNGQHWLTLIEANPADDCLKINNPHPGSLENVPNVYSKVRQSFQTVNFHGRTDPHLPPGSYVQIKNDIFGPRRTEHAVLETAYAVKINAQARPSPHRAPEAFDVEKPLYVSGGLATLEVLASLRGRGGLIKWGRGELILTNANTTRGDNEINEGALASTQSSEAPLGTGSITLLGSGGLLLRPDHRPGEGVTLSVAPGQRSHVTFGGGNRLEFHRGDNGSLTVSLGGWTDGRTPNLRRSGTGTLRIIPGSGLAELGRTERLVVVGSKGNLPHVANRMVEPSIIGRDHDGSGAFLSYERMNGFVVAETTSSHHVPITQSTPTTRYSVENAQVIPAGHTVSAYAICIGRRHTVRSGGTNSTLQLRDRDSSGTAGLILNGGRVEATTLQFGGARGLVHTSRAGGRIKSDILGRRGVTFFGASRLRLTGHNTYGGGTVIDSGRIVVANPKGTGLGTGDVRVLGGAALIVDGKAAHVAGKVTLLPDSSLILRGGTIGALKMVYGDYTNVGGLRGFGTIAGRSEISGIVRAGGQIGLLTFQDHVSFSNTCFYWTLSALDAEPGHEGVHWNSLVFNGTTRFAVDDFYIFLNFTRAIPNPNRDVPFWRQPRQWLLARFNAHRPFLHKRSVAPFDFQYTAGNFEEFTGTFNVKPVGHEVYLTYTPDS